MSSAPRKGWAPHVLPRDTVTAAVPCTPVLAFTTKAERDEAARGLEILAVARVRMDHDEPPALTERDALRTRLAEAERLLVTAYVYTAADRDVDEYNRLVKFLGDPESLYRQHADEDDDTRDWLRDARIFLEPDNG